MTHYLTLRIYENISDYTVHKVLGRYKAYREQRPLDPHRLPNTIIFHYCTLPSH